MVYKTLLFFVTTAVFWWYGSVVLDPDFGWHLRTGSIIAENGIPKTDPFSYTMPSYAFVDHEWLTDFLIALLYPLIGYGGLALIFAVIATGSLFLISAHFNRYILMLPFLLAATTLILFAGIRPQVISWLLFSLLLFICLDNKRFTTWRFFIPLLFFFWANLHGGFPAGLAAFTVILLGKMLKEHKLKKDLVLIGLLSVVATLINPYKLRLWSEIWASIADKALANSIAEWTPMLFMPHLAFWFFLPFSLFFIIRYRKKISLQEVLLFAGLLIAGLASRRHIPFFLIASLFMTCRALVFLHQEAKQYADALARLRKVSIVFGAFTFVVVASQLYLQHRIMRTFSEDSFYPKQAVVFLKNHPSRGNLCSIYNWGGYLIWKLPEKKVCIDGRMPSWKQRGSTHPDESDNAFLEFQKLGSGEISLVHIAEKYKIDTLLLPQKQAKKNLSIETAIQKIVIQMFQNQEKKRKYPNLETQLTKDNWIKIYEDPVSTIYRKTKD